MMKGMDDVPNSQDFFPRDDKSEDDGKSNRSRSSSPAKMQKVNENESSNDFDASTFATPQSGATYDASFVVISLPEPSSLSGFKGYLNNFKAGGWVRKLVARTTQARPIHPLSGVRSGSASVPQESHASTSLVDLSEQDVRKVAIVLHQCFLQKPHHL
jgi:hypothetical protein